MVLDDVIIEQIAIVASHLQCRMTHKPLKRERIAAAVHKILPSEGMPERMDRSPLHASCVVVLHDCQPECILRKQVTEFIAEQIVRRRSGTNCHVIPKNRHHGRAERNDLNLAVLRVSENDLFSGKVYVLDLDVSHCGSPTTAVEKEVYDDPISVFTERAILFCPLQQCYQLFVSIGFNGPFL